MFRIRLLTFCTVPHAAQFAPTICANLRWQPLQLLLVGPDAISLIVSGGMSTISQRLEAVSFWIGCAAVAWPLTTRAQQPDGMRRIAALMDTDDNNSDGQTRVAALREALQQFGWIGGRNIRIDLRGGGGDVERTRGFAAELVHLSPDVIFAYAKAQLAPLSRETRMIPIVFCGASAPVEDGFIASFAHPGGNITGFTQYEPSMVGKWLGALKEIAPNTGQVAIVVNPE